VIAFDPQAIKAQFPILAQTVNGKPLTYLDSAATTQKPQAVIDALVHHYSADNANIHRAVYQLGERSTTAYEAARGSVQRFLNAPEAREIIFTRGATEALNLVASSFLKPRIQPGDEVLVGALEHHANIVPWQMAGATVVAAPVDANGDLIWDAFVALIGPRTKLISVGQVSNAIGSTLPVERICALARERGIPTVVDGAQAAPHGPVDVQAIGCDFFTFSGHKVYAPTGIGALWGRAELLSAMPPYQGGGDMIDTVTFARSTFAEIPARFEAGTPHIAGAVGLGAALEWLMALDLNAVAAHEQRVTQAIVDAIEPIEQVRLIGRPSERGSVVSFLVDGLHPHDLGTLLDQYGVCVRVGHHCAQPAMQQFGVDATVRASVGVYNTVEDAAVLADALKRIIRLFT
jgi:cysteine desulfurase/selenocysteine lyase